MTTKKATKFIGCQVKELPREHLLAAAKTAIDVNPANRPRAAALPQVLAALEAGRDGARGAAGPPVSRPEFLAVLTTKYFGAKGVRLGVSFMETTAAALRDKIIEHMNAWAQFCNAHFAWSQSGGEVRISRGRGGYYSYLGTDVLHIPAGQQTMNLEGFTLNTPDSEYKRVVRHETGHTLGFPHEHMRREIIAKLDPQKTVAYFQRTQGWDAQTTTEQVLTPVEEASLMGTPHADETSIMTYQLPGAITVDGKPIVGGTDIDAIDQAFVAKLYPLETAPPPPSGKKRLVIEFTGDYAVVPA